MVSLSGLSPSSDVDVTVICLVNSYLFRFDAFDHPRGTKEPLHLGEFQEMSSLMLFGHVGNRRFDDVDRCRFMRLIISIVRTRR